MSQNTAPLHHTGTRMLHRQEQPLVAPSGPVTIDLCQPQHADEWNRYVEGHPGGSFYHLYQWSRINDEELGNRSYFFAARANGAIVGILPLTFIASPWFGRILCSMPYVNYGGPCADTPEIREQLVHEAVRLTRELNARYLELRTRETIAAPLPVSLRKISLTLELKPDPDQLWNAFTSKHRTNVRRAQKNELTVRDGGVELLSVFYSLMEASWQQLGTPLYRRSYFERILAEFPTYTRIFVCMQRDEPIAVAFNGYCNGVVEGMWAGGGPRARELQANYVLYWEMIRDACMRGCRSYHLGRSTADSGAEDFKKKWNATSQQLYWYFHRPDGGPMPELNVANPKYQLAIAAWRKLPLWATRMIGPVLARSIP